MVSFCTRAWAVVDQIGGDVGALCEWGFLYED